MKKRQDTIIRLAKSENDILRLPEQIDFYKKEGFNEDEIFHKK